MGLRIVRKEEGIFFAGFLGAIYKPRDIYIGREQVHNATAEICQFCQICPGASHLSKKGEFLKHDKTPVPTSDCPLPDIKIRI